MDWPKAKNILIAMFIGLNIFLLSSIASERRVSTVSGEALSNTFKILEANGIHFTEDFKFPGHEGGMYMLDYQQDGDMKEELIGKFFGDMPVSSAIEGDQQVFTGGSRKLVISHTNSFTYSDSSVSVELDLSGKEDTEKYIRNYLSDLGFNPFKFMLDHSSETEDGRVYTFVEEYNGSPIFKNQVQVAVSARGITSVSGGYIKVKSFSGSARKVMPAHQVLLKNSQNMPEVTITRVDLGYEGFNAEIYNDSTMITSQSPVWRIIAEDGSVFYFKAYDGEKVE